MKAQQDILNKLNIEKLNPMQEEAFNTVKSNSNTVILSPTGTGKTLAFILPLLERLSPDVEGVQALILVPSRELAIQIEQVIREIGSGYKVNAVYGGRSLSKDKVELKHTPSILVGTPGRVEDHLRNGRFETSAVRTLILDEFDKSLETGFENEMRRIIKSIPKLEKRILTSATQELEIPEFTGVTNEKVINYLNVKRSKLTIKTIEASSNNKLPELVDLLNHLGDQPGIIFCNYKDTIRLVSDYLSEHHIPYGCFYGGMEQMDREHALIKFRNGTQQIIIATDLAARGLDIPELKFIIHYQLPFKVEEFIHRNGRTARVDAEGTAFVLKGANDRFPDFIERKTIIKMPTTLGDRSDYNWETLFISGGRKDKISKGDIAGLFFKQGNLTKTELGVIELKQDCAYISVPKSEANRLVSELNNSRLKKKKVRISIL